MSLTGDVGGGPRGTGGNRGFGWTVRRVQGGLGEGVEGCRGVAGTRGL